MALSPFSITQSTSMTTSLEIPPTLPIDLRAVTGNGDRRTVPHAAYCDSCDLDCTLQKALNNSQPCVISSVNLLSFGGNYPCLLFSCQSTRMVFHFTFVLGSQLTLLWSDEHRLNETPAYRPSPGPALPEGRKQPAPTKALSSSASSSPPIISWAQQLSFCISTAPHLLNIL